MSFEFLMILLDFVVYLLFIYLFIGLPEPYITKRSILTSLCWGFSCFSSVSFALMYLDIWVFPDFANYE